jgi:hypothetical protein
MLNFMALHWPQGWKKDTIKFGRPKFATLGANLQPKNAQSWPKGFLALTPSVKRPLKYLVNLINCHQNLGKTKGN